LGYTQHDIPPAAVLSAQSCSAATQAPDWDGDGHYDHLAIVTGSAKDNSQYPLVSEWGVYDPTISNPFPATQYPQRGWSWSTKNNTWLLSEDGHANMQAAPIHIDTTVPSSY